MPEKVAQAQIVIGPIGPILGSTQGVHVVRPEDLFVARIETQHLTRTVEPDEQGNPKAWLKPDGSGGSRIILHLPPQNIAEQAFFQTAVEYPPQPPNTEPLETPTAGSIPVQTRLAGPSRLVFIVPNDAKPIGYTLAEILDACRALAMGLSSSALPPPEPRIIFVPAWTGSIATLVAGDEAAAPDAGKVRATAKLQRWEDNSDLVPVTRLGPFNLLTSQGPDGPALVLDQRLVAVYAAPAAPTAAASTGGTTTTQPTPVPKIPLPGGGGGEIDLTIPVPGPILVTPDLHKPTVTETALELPYRLLISPNRHGRWAHAIHPVKSSTGTIELWHTRLGTLVNTRLGPFVDENDHRLRTIRAIWTRDPGFSTDHTQAPPHTNDPFRMSVDAADRHGIVHQTANFKIKSFNPLPVDVNRLMLTSLGGWLDSRGRWDPPSPLELLEWRHRAAMGRDHYVRVVIKGFLFPFGHSASLVKVTERKFHPNVAGNPAFLRQRMYIVVRRPVMTYGDRRLTNASGHFYDFQMPFTSIRITNLVTPDLNDPLQSDYPLPPQAGEGQSLFWPRVGNEFFRFHMVAEDIEANRVDFTAPVIFVSNKFFNNTAALTTVRNDYEQAANRKNLRTVPLHGQRMALAESLEPGDTAFEVENLVFGAEIPDDATFAKFPADRPRFYPRVLSSNIVVPTIKQLTGGSGKAEVAFAEDFLKKGLPTPTSDVGNPGEVFLRTLASAALDFTSGGDKSGALAQPNLTVAGISRLMGPVGGTVGNAANLSSLAQGNFTPSSFFDSIKAKLFGVIELGELIQALLPNDLDLVPKFVTEAMGAAESFLKEIQRAQQVVQQVQSAATSAGQNIDAAANAVLGHLGPISGAVSGLLGGNLDTAPLTSVLSALTLDLGSLRTVVANLPKEVPNEAKKAALSTVDKVLTLLEDVAAFVDRLVQALQVAEELKISFEWKPKLNNWPSADETDAIFIKRNTKSNKPASFVVSASAQAKTKLNPSPTFDVACRLHNFSLNLFPGANFLRLHFNKIEFVAGSATKPDVVCDFDDVEFVGVLSFVEALRDLIPLDGFSDPPALEVSEKGIQASYSLGLPALSFGVFSLQNLSLGAGFTVPFLVDPLSVRFNFCERESPFILTVSAIGGGGFFGITLDPDGIQILEASFEVGAELAINLGVASGSVHIMIGIYFKMQNDEATLEGYVRIGGEMEILAIISLSIELYLSLTYEFSSGKCVGRATITVEIEILFFSTSVEVSCERKFAGSSGDPTFAELMAPEGDVDPWAEYCAAFA